MVFTFQISLMTWFETKSTGLLRIFIMPRIMQVLCSRGRDDNGKISYGGKSCQGRLQGALQQHFRARGWLKSCCRFLSVLFSHLWPESNVRIRSGETPNPSLFLGLLYSCETLHQVCEFRGAFGWLRAGGANLYFWPSFWRPHGCWVMLSLKWPPPGRSQDYPRLMWRCQRHRINRFCRKEH